MTEWTEGAKIAFGLMISAFVISLAAYYMYIGGRLNNEISKQEANKVLMREYREYNGYNDKAVYAQDVVSLVMKKRGEPAIQIVSGGVQTSYWCSDTNIYNTLAASTWVFKGPARQDTYTATAVQERLNINKMYLGTIDYSENGEVIGVTFTVGSVDDAGVFTAD